MKVPLKLDGTVPVKPPKRRMDWLGKYVRTLRDMQNGMMLVPEGAVCIVRHSHRGASLRTVACACCGVSVHLDRVEWVDLEYIGDLPSPFDVPEHGKLEAHNTGDGWYLTIKDTRTGDVMREIEAPEHWPEVFNRSFLIRQGFEVV